MRWHPAVHCLILLSLGAEAKSWNWVVKEDGSGHQVCDVFSLENSPSPPLYLNAVVVIICPKGLGFQIQIIMKQARKHAWDYSPLPHHWDSCLPSSIFIEHLQCTRHNRTYRKHCPCSGRAYILKEKKYTSCKMAFLFGVFCKVLRKYSVGYELCVWLSPIMMWGGGGRILKGDGDRPFRAGLPGR